MVVDRMQILPIPCTKATTFCLSMGYKFGCMITSNTLFDSKGGFSGSSYPMKTADFEVLRDVATATIFGFLYMGSTLAPPEEYG